MRRIHVFFVIVTGLALLATCSVGVLSWMQGGLFDKDSAVYMIHFHLGLYTSIAVFMIHCLVMTYFLGTGRWVKEVTLAYDLPDDRWARPTRDFKREGTPRYILAMLLTIVTAAAGVGRQQLVWPGWIHFTLAILTLLVNVRVFFIQMRNIARNGQIIDEVMAEVERIRAAAGLPSSEELLREEQETL